MSADVFVKGWGAVSPAGWGMRRLMEALQNGTPLPAEPMAHPAFPAGLAIRKVPNPDKRPPHAAHPRFRRSSLIAQFAGAAAAEALGGDQGAVTDPGFRLGVVYCVMNGCVNFSRRFYAEVLQNPATASPLLFPETVANSPASHIAALLGARGLNYTLVGEETSFLQGMAIAADWIVDKRVDACLVIGAEELDWLVSGGAALFDPGIVVSEGAGALFLSRDAEGAVARLEKITEPVSARNGRTVTPVLWAAGARNSDVLFASDSAALQEFQGTGIAVRPVLGNAFTATAAWQAVAALEFIRRGEPAATVQITGSTRRLAAARFSAAMT